MSETITLNQEDYTFGSYILTQKTVIDSANQPTENSNGIEISFRAFNDIQLIDNLFSPYTDLNCSLIGTGNSVEQIEDSSFLLNSNNNNELLLILSHRDFFPQGGLPGNNLSEPQKLNNISFRGTILKSYNSGGGNSATNFMVFNCVDRLYGILDEIKISETDKKNINKDKTVSQHVYDILSLALPPQFIDEPTFNIGDLRLSYTFPHNYTALQAINFLLPFCITKKLGLDCQLLLKYDKVKQKYEFQSAFEPFINSTAPEYNTERFIIASPGYITNQGNNQPNSIEFGPDATVISTSKSKFKSSGGITKENIINTFSFKNVDYCDSNSNYVSVKIVNPADPLLASVISVIDIKEEITRFNEKILAEMQNLYGGSLRLNIDLDQSKIDNKNYKILKSGFDSAISERIARAQLYSTFIYENMFLSITVPGRLYREPNKWIVIDKTLDGNRDTSIGSEFDTKLIGQWLVTEVKHRIDSRGLYVNDISCVRPFIERIN